MKEILDFIWKNRDLALATVGEDDGAGQVGDLLLLGVDSPRHTTVISGFVTDGSGKTVDYLLCSGAAQAGLCGAAGESGGGDSGVQGGCIGPYQRVRSVCG